LQEYFAVQKGYETDNYTGTSVNDMKRLFSIISDLFFSYSRLRLILGMLFMFILFSLLTVILTRSGEVKTQPAGWENFRRYSPAGVQCRNVNSDRNGNTCAIIYEGMYRGEKGIYVNVSYDAGGSFMPPVKIAGFQSQINNAPCIAISGKGDMHAVWYVISEDGSEGSIFHSRSADLGANWSVPERVTFGLQMEIIPVLRFDDRNVLHLFFTAYSGKLFSLYHSVYGKEGLFEKPGTVAELEGDVKGAFFSAIKFTGRNVSVVWQAKEKNYADSLYFASSDNYGAGWSGGERITPPGSNYQAPSLEVVDGVIYLVFMNNSERNWAVKMLKSGDWGDHWDSSPLPISATNANCFSPFVAAGPERELFIAWHDTREKGNRVFLRTYDIRTRALSPETGLSVRNRPGRNAVVLNTLKRLAVFWEEGGTIVSLFSDIHVDAPVVRSKTHPPGSWTKNVDGVVEWSIRRDESGIAGFATMVDKNPESVPTIQNLRYDVNRFYVTGLEDGVTYFHIRTVDGAGNMSRTVHYKLQVSSNPLSMPVVISTTHPENGKSVKTDALFRWAVNDTRRLKGFVYSLGKDVALRPDKFIEDFEVEFNNLENGVYYFNIAAISKTNQVSSVTTYCFIVGTEGEFNTDYMKGLADRDYGLGIREKVAALEPYVEINLPLGASGYVESGDFNAIVSVRNVAAHMVHGFSAVVGEVRREPPGKINMMNNILAVKGLSEGKYTMGVKCRYERYSRGRKVTAWTKPAYVEFTVRFRGIWSPLDDMYLLVMEKIKKHPFAITGFMFLFALTVAYAGYGDRIIFYLKLARFRIRYYF